MRRSHASRPWSSSAGNRWQIRRRVRMTHCGYLARQSHMHGTFDKSMSSPRRLPRPDDLMARAIARAGPWSASRCTASCWRSLPSLGPTIPCWPGRRRAADPEPRGHSVVVTGDVSADRVHADAGAAGVTRGEGVLTTRLDPSRPGPVTWGPAWPPRALLWSVTRAWRRGTYTRTVHPCGDEGSMVHEPPRMAARSCMVASPRWPGAETKDSGSIATPLSLTTISSPSWLLRSVTMTSVASACARALLSASLAIRSAWLRSTWGSSAPRSTSSTDQWMDVSSKI